jgi:hypothetical protein
MFAMREISPSDVTEVIFCTFEDKYYSLFWVRVLVFNATVNNISVVSWRSVLLMEETGVPEKFTDMSHERDSNSQPLF